ncbi:MAG: SRPBCC domain-containing protein [Chloroflexota bacterium]
MKSFSASTTINATPETIWAILTDGPSYPEWDPGMIKLEGTVAAGEKIVAHAKISPDRTFPVTVSNFVPNETMTWSSAMPLGLFSGARTFTLTPKGEGITEVSVREEFKGLLLPLIGRTIPDLTESFEAFVAGLKSRAEQG